VRLRLLAIGLGLCSGPALAAGPHGHAFRSAPERLPARRSFDIRLVQQPPASLAPIRQAGMIAQTAVAPDMDIGLGLFSARRNRLNPLEPRSDSRAKPSRKLGVNFNWRF
jgi:hypothetical protein